MKIVTAAEMRAVDSATSERFGVPSLTLMENAGTAVAEHVLTHHAAARRIVIFCGKGNNGGDGFVAARRLHQKGKAVQVILLADPSELKGDAAAMYAKLPVAAIIVHTSEELKSDRVRLSLPADLYLDAILGTGFNPPVSGLYADAIAVLNAARAPVIAVDIPSGADADAMTPQKGIVARADSIVTFTAARPAHVFSLLTNGPTYVAGIGSPEEAIVSSLRLNVITVRDFAPLLDPRPAESNKGNYGHVLVIGGSVGKAGAAAMAGMSALRAGAGLATVATPKSVLPTVAGFHPEVMTESLPETDAGTISAAAVERLDALAKGKSVLAIGPGISRFPTTSGLVRTLVSKNELPIVLDADGLNAFEGHAGELNGKGRLLVITPHPGEMARLAACSIADVQKDRLGVARKFARQHDVIVVLKGHRTLVVQPDGEAWANTTGNPGMATGGTGDILTGMIAAMIAQHPKDALLAVLAAVHLHGRAGDEMREILGEHSLVATDLLRGLPDAFESARQTVREKFVCWEG
ncbi:Bifunctional NAD(P)H-hydrate repair enzyme Nnr (Includes: ADP-dependent (S)-NAD(P)H-hydrate dehydratase; NAD(P)H-hydrate epimerase) [Candidatus Sulfotelmatobacter kueseliae]|uniref:Bifunctional NAD(P)H-hydrate repair enzyme n=1 Tax=Candidatus Sulfotelmatobacter kueseliae TaxID=2042962 RepID=A0A2U3KI15_9BACT|nr:Bifunctional NAD(P)H-hydrate repair enzyme Nnr (Includes: ADP-dependent (S)-NAD(P)H-hydrate dehydratase; NAD(P)H-hydrate epimerase) [Candidatus Sulfotelmatobacter kueseliae]